MSRFKYLLDVKPIAQAGSKTIGIFPFNSLVDPDKTDIYSGAMAFHESAVQGLKLLAEKNYSVVLFINQFKKKPLPPEHFMALNQALEGFVKSHGINVVGLYWCPSTDRNDPYVVPGAGMFTRATENQGISWEGIDVISTSDNDLIAAERAKANPIKIGKGSSKWTLHENLLDYASIT